MSRSMRFNFVLVPLLCLCSGLAGQTSRPSPVIVGYVPAWRDKVADPANFNYGVCTHLCRAFLRPKDDGTLTQEPGFFNDALEQHARMHGVKLLMSIGGEAKSPDRWLSIARDPAHLHTFLDAIDSLYQQHRYDGVDIDWEPPPQNEADGQLYLGLLKAVRARFPDKLLTVALSAGDYGVGHLPLKEVIDTIDYLNAMTYDYSGPWTGIATFPANLYPDAAGARTRTSVSDALTNLLQKHNVPANKVVVGMNFWPNRFRVDALGDRFAKNTKGDADNVEYSRVMDLLASGRYSLHRDAIADAPYMVRNEGGCVITFTDAQAVTDICKYAQKLGCAGVMMWHVGADLDDGATPLLDAVAQQFVRPVTAARAAQEDSSTRLQRGVAEDDRWLAQAPPPTPPATRPANTP